MERFKLQLGDSILYRDVKCILIARKDLNEFLVEEVERNTFHTVKISDILPIEEKGNSSRHFDENIDLLSEKEWKECLRRFEIIQPLIEYGTRQISPEEIAKNHEIHTATIYRWLKKFKEGGRVSSLIDRRNGGKGTVRISSEKEKIIQEVIKDVYQTTDRKSIPKTIREVKKRCRKQRLNPPSEYTIRSRIKDIGEEATIRGRFGKRKAEEKFKPKINQFKGATHPLSVVQIDHTKLDIILVDEENRNPFQRPWITLAIDVYSRMVVGFHLSFDPPGAHGTGLCVASCILTKDQWLASYNIDAEWPVWGIMDTLHADNAKEFRGNMLKKYCAEYGINLEFRPVKQPEYGAHIERLLGTLNNEIHDIDGTTFSNTYLKDNYPSEKKAVFDIKQLEQWLLIYLTKVYHQRTHSTLGISPLQKYKEGITGVDGGFPTGTQPVFFDRKRVRLDFTPYLERQITEYGVIIDRIQYYHDVLRRYIHARNEFDRKQKFIFKRDPRDISVIYFWDPEAKEYFEIPYRNTLHPPISIWEYRESVRRLNDQKIPVDEDAIFDAYEELEEIERKAIEKTKKRRLKKTSRKADSRNKLVHDVKKEEAIASNNIESDDEIIPFDDFDDNPLL